jgi:hypothetical protein
MYSPELVIVLNQIAQVKRGEFESALTQVLNNPPYRNTGEGVNSVKVLVMPGTEAAAPQIKIEFADHLLFMDKRKMQWTKLPPISKLLPWAATRSTDPKQQKKIAWSKAWDLKKNDNWKAKPWRKKSLSAVLKEMNTEIIRDFGKAIEEMFQRATQVK